MNTYTVEITEEDIVTGKHNGYDCPVAKALKKIKLIGPVVGVNSFSYIDLITGKVIDIAWNSEKISNFINDFDNQKEVKPFKFMLKI